MPSPATRSARLIAKQSQDEKESKDVADKKAPSSPSKSSITSSKSKKSSGGKSPKSFEDPKETSIEKNKSLLQNSNQGKNEKIASPSDAQEPEVKDVIMSEQLKAEEFVPDVSVEKISGHSDINTIVTTPSSSSSASTLRRSRRAPVPSSRFKDMELGMTPNSQKMKRLMSPSGDSDPLGEPSPKRSKKNSSKSIEISQNDCEKKDLALSSPSEGDLSHETLAKDVSSRSTQRMGEEEKNEKLEADEKPSEAETKQGSETDVSKTLPQAKGLEAVTETPSNNNDDDKSESEDMEVVSAQSDGLNPQGSVNEIVMKASSEERSFGNDTTEQNVVLSPDLSGHDSNQPVEGTPQEITVEEVGLSCHDAGIIVEETVHTYMDEKDVVIENSNTIENTDSTEETSSIQTSKKLELSVDKDVSAAISSSIMIKGQEVTVQERDGKMVAIVKIPAKFGNHFTGPASENELTQSETLAEEEYPMSSSLRNVALNTSSSQKSRHGYILNKKNEKQFVTVSDQDQNTLNISLEPTTISSILKSKSDSGGKATAKSLYGRVIKQDPLVTKTNSETLIVQGTSPSSLLVKNTGPNQKISLLSHSIKATNPKESKPYSLLSSPSELLQKLKSDSEKKQQASKLTHESKKKSHISSPPKKVVIITHPPKSDDHGEKASVSSVIINPSKENIIHIESGQVESAEPSQTDPTASSMDSELESTSQGEQNVLPQIRNTDVVEEVATDSQFLDVSNKVEEIIVQDMFPNVENAELTLLEGKDKDHSGEASIERQEVSGNEDNPEGDGSKTKELIMESAAVSSLSESTEGDDNVMSDLIITTHDDKSAAEETVITSSEQSAEVVEVKQELGMESGDEIKTVELLDLDAQGKNGDTNNTPKTQKIKLVDNGVVYELQIFSEDENKSFQDGALELEGVEGEAGMIVKQEIIEDGENTSNETAGKSSLGTQTVFTSKRGRPRASDDKEDSPVHKLTTIVQEGGQKKHYYYVSVLPGKNVDGKYRRSVDHSLPGCVVNEVGEYCCTECGYKTDKKANFYKHRRLHTGSKPHVCHVCKYQARTSSNLKRHMGIHEDIREFKCNQCSLSFRQKIHLERHIRYRHEEKRVKCPMCDYVCANEQPDLKMHIKRKHTRESGKVFTCPQCNIEVGSKRDLKQHLKFHKDGPELKLFCKECSFVTDCKSRLQRHLVVHSNVKPYHCGVCDYKATQKEHVVRHLRSQHKIEVNKPKRPWKKQIKQEASEALGGNSRGDFTCGDKIFACNHCTMRFAKLINLYKHLHTQHSDIMPAETESNYYCVVCEFSTSSKKNLLVHMRRHNMTDQTPPTHVYSCVLCRYVNPRRRNLFQHMRKKHNIDISTQVDIAGMTEEEEAAARQDGDKMAEFIHTDHSVFTTQASTEEMSASANFESVEGSPQVLKDNLAGVANMIKIEDLTRGVPAGADSKDATSLVIDSGDGTQLIQAASLMQHKAADAIEGLQALAGQAGLIIDEDVSVLKPSRIVIEQADGEVLNTTDATLSDGSIILAAADQSIVEEQITIDEASSEQIQQIVESVESADPNSGLTSLELTEEQLSSLHHGDIVQMEGQVYMVEIAQDPESPEKQLLSFLPISQG